MSAGDRGDGAYREHTLVETQRGLTLKKMLRLPPIRFGDHALRFPRKSYQHMANEPALPVAVVAPGARATSRW
jgi:hypothetical protein